MKCKNVDSMIELLDVRLRQKPLDFAEHHSDGEIAATVGELGARLRLTSPTHGVVVRNPCATRRDLLWEAVGQWLEKWRRKRAQDAQTGPDSAQLPLPFEANP